MIVLLIGFVSKSFLLSKSCFLSAEVLELIGLIELLELIGSVELLGSVAEFDPVVEVAVCMSFNFLSFFLGLVKGSDDINVIERIRMKAESTD